MRKLSILALVVILAGALSVVGYAGEDTASSEVLFSTGSNISLTVDSGDVVDFGTNLDPNSAHYKTKATKLNLTSNTDWVINSSKAGSAKSSLTVKLGGPKGLFSWNTVTGSPNDFKNGLNSSMSGSGDKSGIDVSYMLDDLAGLEEGTEHTVTVTFTATTQ